MFRNLMSFWKGKDFIASVLNEFKGMLDHSEHMFQVVCERMLESTNGPELKQSIYDIDKQVNVQQRDIRRRIVEHLTLQPTIDTTACLVLMSVIKDAERLGDYCKNLMEVSDLADPPMDRAQYEDYFGGMNQEIDRLFSLAKKAFIDADESMARQTWDIKRRNSKACDKIVRRVAKSDMSTNAAVCFTLTARYYKRMVAHLTNIATAVVVPLSDLDYFDERDDEGQSFEPNTDEA